MSHLAIASPPQVLDALDLETRISDRTWPNSMTSCSAPWSTPWKSATGDSKSFDSFDRPSLENLAPTLTSGLEERITARIDGFVQLQRTSRTAVPALVRRSPSEDRGIARETMLAEVPNISVENGEVSLNTIPIIVEAIRRVLPDLSGLGPDITLPEQRSQSASRRRGHNWRQRSVPAFRTTSDR